MIASVESLKNIKNSIIYLIRKFSLRDFYNFERNRKAITKRQFDLLSLLLDNQINFTLKDLLEKTPFSILYNKTSTQTARRDIKKLADMKLLTTSEDNKYCLNLRVL